MDCDKCALEPRIKTAEQELDRNRESHEKIYSRLNEIEGNNRVNKSQFERIMETLGELKSEVQEIKNKPSKRWDTIVSAALQWVVVAILASVIILK